MPDEIPVIESNFQQIAADNLTIGDLAVGNLLLGIEDLLFTEYGNLFSTHHQCRGFA
jgi:hypothetical protein